MLKKVKKKIKFKKKYLFIFCISILMLSILLFSGLGIKYILLDGKNSENNSHPTSNKKIPWSIVFNQPNPLSSKKVDELSQVLNTILSIKGSKDNPVIDNNIGLLGLLNSFSSLFTYHADKDTKHKNYSSGLSLMLLEAVPQEYLHIPLVGGVIDDLLNKELQKRIFDETTQLFTKYNNLIISNLLKITNLVFSTIGIDLDTKTWSTKIPSGGQTNFLNVQTFIEQMNPTLLTNFVVGTLFDNDGDKAVFAQVKNIINEVNKTLNGLGVIIKTPTDVTDFLRSLVREFVFFYFDKILSDFVSYRY